MAYSFAIAIPSLLDFRYFGRRCNRSTDCYDESEREDRSCWKQCWHISSTAGNSVRRLPGNHSSYGPSQILLSVSPPHNRNCGESARTQSPPVSAIALAAALTILFVLAKSENVSKTYIELMSFVIAASIVYNVYYYYPLVGGNPDALSSLAVASGILHSGHFSSFTQPIDVYYLPMPAMAIAPSILSLVSGLDLELAMLIFPGSLILLQPLLIFLLTRMLVDDSEAAVLSSLVVVIEATVTRFMNQPFAQAVATSMLLVVLVALVGLGRFKSYIAIAIIAFAALVLLHGGEAVISIAVIFFC